MNNVSRHLQAMTKPFEWLLNNIYAFWLVLALPAMPLVADVISPARYYPELMWETGILATQLTVVALAITPLMRLVKPWKAVTQVVRWFQKRRRAIGIAAFGYAALHTYFYIRYVGSLEYILLELTEIDLAVGWIAFLFFILLALTSNTFSVQRLGARWKPLQRLAYLAAAFTALHWYLIGQFEAELFTWFVPLLVLQIIRIGSERVTRKPRTAPQT